MIARISLRFWLSLVDSCSTKLSQVLRDLFPSLTHFWVGLSNRESFSVGYNKERRMKRNRARTGRILLVMAALGGLAGCQTVAEQTGWTKEHGVDPGPSGNVTVGIGTSTETQTAFCWNENEQLWKGHPDRLIVKEESFTDSFYKGASGTGQLAGGAGLLALGIEGVENSANAAANASATSTTPRPAPN